MPLEDPSNIRTVDSIVSFGFISIFERISFRSLSRKCPMAKWIYQRPLDSCDHTELVVAKRLVRLGNEWVIRWGFYYETDREGDFLILGPTGGVLVLEVKGGS